MKWYLSSLLAVGAGDYLPQSLIVAVLKYLPPWFMLRFNTTSFPFFSASSRRNVLPCFSSCQQHTKVSGLPIRLQRWNGYSLFGTLVGCEETPVCLAVRLSYICRGVLLRPDRWVCTTGQRWVENIHSLYWSAALNIGHGEQRSAHGILGRYLVIYF